MSVLEWQEMNLELQRAIRRSSTPLLHLKSPRYCIRSHVATHPTDGNKYYETRHGATWSQMIREVASDLSHGHGDIQILRTSGRYPDCCRENLISNLQAGSV